MFGSLIFQGPDRLCRGFPRIWSGHHYHLFNRTYIYKWWISQPATVCVSSINFRFHVTLRAVFLVCKNWIVPVSSLQKVCESIVFYGGGGEETQGRNTQNNTSQNNTLHRLWQRSPCAVSAMLRAAVILAALLPSDGLERVESWIVNLSNEKACFLVVGDLNIYIYIYTYHTHISYGHLR